MKTGDEHLGYLGHDDDNKVTILYSGTYDTATQQSKELAKIVRSGRLVRHIKDEEGARAVWGETVSEKRMNEIAHPLSYDPDEYNARQIANLLVDEAIGAPASR